jgi:phosphopantetheinyl transferase
MPLILKKDTDRATLLLWSADENEEQLRMLVTECDRASVDDFASPARRIERLAWRAAMRTVVPDAGISYSETGAPIVDKLPLHIGVAHTRGLAAVIVSREPCAVDVESTTRDFTRSRARFISPREALLTDAAHPYFATAVWCAKEAMYKYSGQRGLDFLDDLQVTVCDLARGVMCGQIGTTEINITILCEKDYMIVFI